MDEGSEVTEDIIFRGVEFSVKIEVDQRLLMVEISDLITADQWRGDFDPACKWHIIYHRLNGTTGKNSRSAPIFFNLFYFSDIEDLTRKTGNFKQFPIFCSMLESAIRKVCSTVHTERKEI